MPESPALARSALYLPAANARAIEKAKGLAADMLILDLEDSVAPADKPRARLAAAEATRDTAFAGRWMGIRLNAAGTAEHAADIETVRASAARFAVLPKVEDAKIAAEVAAALGVPLFAMIETPKGVFAAREIAAADGVSGLIAGMNDLAAALRQPAQTSRGGLVLALQMIVLAARAAGGLALDGVWNHLEDATGLEAECLEGKIFGFDGKTLIHPNQIAIANRVYGPSQEALEEARAMVEAATCGAERFRGRMIETMHVEAAKRLLAAAVFAGT